MTYYVGHSSRGLWGLVWSDLINLNYVVCIGSQRYHFLWLYNKIGWKKHKKQVWFASLVWYDRVSSVETSLFRPSIYLVWVLGALEALQCIICHYLRTELRNYGITESRTDQAFYYNRYRNIEWIVEKCGKKPISYFLILPELILNMFGILIVDNSVNLWCVSNKAWSN